jgi:hypothetical protein
VGGLHHRYVRRAAYSNAANLPPPAGYRSLFFGPPSVAPSRASGGSP